MLELIPQCAIAVEEHGGGQYRVTLPSWAARELGVGTKSLIPEWRMSARLGVRAQASDPVRRPPGPLGGAETSFTLSLSPEPG